MDLITINLRGTVFKTERDILDNIPGSRLSKLSEDSMHYNQHCQEYFFNRNPAIFHYILDYHMTGKLHVPSHICAESVREEFNFWGIPQGVVEKCCWKSFYQNNDDMDVVQKLLNAIPFKDKTVPKQRQQTQSKTGSIKERIWKFVNDSPSCIKSKVWCGFIYLTILSSIIIYILQSFPIFRKDLDVYVEFPNKGDHPPTETAIFFWNTTTIQELIWADSATNLILSFDWIIRMITCPNKIHFILNILNVTDLIAIVSIWFSLWIESESEKRKLFLFVGSNEVLFIVATCYATRILRIFRLAQHNVGMKILLLSLKSSARELGILVLSLLCFTLTFAVMIFIAELTSQNSKLNTFFSCTWWSVITMTSVGYGDVFPTTGVGYVVGGLSAIMGILLTALPVAVTSSNFNDFYTFNKYRMRYREDQYEERLKRSRRRSFSITSLLLRRKTLTNFATGDTERGDRNERSIELK